MPTDGSIIIRYVYDIVCKQVAEHNAYLTNNPSPFIVTYNEYNTLYNGFFFEVNNARVIEVFVTSLADTKLTEDFWISSAQKRIPKFMLNGKEAKEFISVMVQTNKSNNPYDVKKINNVTFIVVDPDEINGFNIFDHL